jgi:hypothetical protein
MAFMLDQTLLPAKTFLVSIGFDVGWLSVPF